MIDILISFLLYLAGFASAVFLGRAIGLSAKRSFIIYLWHSFFCVIYIAYVIENGGDSAVYYDVSLADDVPFDVGTSAVIWITSFFSKYIGLSYFAVSLVYNLIGTIGLLCLDKVFMDSALGGNSFLHKLTKYIVFLPSISFWSSAVGKDAIAFTAAALSLRAVLLLNQRWLLMIIAIFLMLIVRPHIAGMMVIALAVSVIFRGGVSGVSKFLFIFCALMASAAMILFALQYSGLEDASNLGEFADYVETRQGYNQEGNGGLDISKMSLPMQMFSYIFRPLPFEVFNFFSLAASFENIILLIIAYLGFLSWFRNRKVKNLDRSGMTFIVLYSVFSLIILSMTTANLGISLRQKWMFMPMLMYVAFYWLSVKNNAGIKR